LRILLTDDAASILKVTSRFLTANKHTVVTAENGNQSLERLKNDFGQIDLLITDLQVLYAVLPYTALHYTTLKCSTTSHIVHYDYCVLCAFVCLPPPSSDPIL
jgi:hypothetical protein